MERGCECAEREWMNSRRGCIRIGGVNKKLRSRGGAIHPRATSSECEGETHLVTAGDFTLMWIALGLPTIQELSGRKRVMGSNLAVRLSGALSEWDPARAAVHRSPALRYVEGVTH